ncbi:ATP-dependent DNA helicase [Candidatus Woesearchaeota archaeon]|nr:ATP-dependent DNA helicase [Candidatus Woesearchaeota archaeon]
MDFSKEKQSEFLFPFEKVRKEQDKLLLLIDKAIEFKKNLLVHAPTGLGKTIAVLGPALKNALNNNLAILFLTSRHTQHKIAIETLKKIKEKYNAEFDAVSIIGKKWMCAQAGVQSLYSNEFADYCKKVREDKKCEFYLNTKKGNKLSVVSKNVLSKIKLISPVSTEKLIQLCVQEMLCPYEISLAIASKAKVIITDYYYLFNPSIGENFLTKISRNMDELIVIVDEAHNLPLRLKDLASDYLSSITLKRAIAEARKFGYISTIEIINKIQELLLQLSDDLRINQEKLVKKQDFLEPLDAAYDYEQTIADLEFIGDSIRETQKQSYIGTIARFMERWKGPDESFARILSYKRGLREPYYMLSYRCLDPSIVCSSVVNNTHSTILMSGTLVPIQMYKEVLGVENSQEVIFKDPYPKTNRLNLIIPKTSTKYTMRNEYQFKEIAKITSEIVNAVPGNSAVFFPSYQLRDIIERYFSVLCTKTTFLEDSRMSKEERLDLLERFKGYNKTGAVLLGVASGSFGEGIDLPGDFLKAVIVVGLPLRQPDLETKSLIEYYDKKFSKGWDYGYLIPAMTKAIQNAGRCIRSETDRGIIVFLDERFVWRSYYRLFPKDWDIKVSSGYNEMVSGFFK